MLSRAIIT